MKFHAILPAAIVVALGSFSLADAQTAAPSPTVTSPNTPKTDSGAPIVGGTNAATNNAVNTKPANNAGAPVAGANSFTQNEARRRIQKQGFTKVNGLKLDQQGIWRGMATKGGKSVGVSMDYQGNVVSQ